jgi:hypothetical protein
MPDHDLFDLDGAFASLERDIATISSPRGAGHAVATARRRRRTTYGAVAAVAVLAVGGVAIGQGLGGRDGSIGPSEQPLPPPTPLSAVAFSTATAGWVDGWGKPTDAQGSSLDSISCLSKGPDVRALNASTRQGGALYGAGSSSIAYVLGLEYPADKVDAAAAAIAAAAANCEPTVTSTSNYVGGSQVTYYQIPGTNGLGDIELWTAQLGTRLGLGVIGGTSDTPSPEVVNRMDDLVIGALQVDSTFTTAPDGPTSTGSASASPSSFGSVKESDFAAALGDWPNGWQQRGTKSAGDSLPCAGDWTVGSTFGNGSSLGTNGEQEADGFDSPENARSSVQALAGDLHACAASPATITTVALTGAAPVTVAVGTGSDARVTWIVQRGASVAYISIPGDTAPPALVSEAVAGLMGDALNHVSSSEAPPPVEQSAPAVQQSSGSSSSSGSASANTVPNN